jgi:hypothetical protein
MVIDERHQPKPIRHGFQRCDIAMLVGAERELGWGLGEEPVEELIRGAKMEPRDRPRFAIDAARFHDAVVGMAPGFDFLNACHTLCIQEAKKGVKPLDSIRRAPFGLCIPFSEEGEKPKAQRIKDFATSSACVGRLLPESRARPEQNAE